MIKKETQGEMLQNLYVKNKNVAPFERKKDSFNHPRGCEGNIFQTSSNAVVLEDELGSSSLAQREASKCSTDSRRKQMKRMFYWSTAIR